MATFLEEILEDINWRIAELATIKSFPIKYNFSLNHKEIQIKYSIPAIYAIWEGFVKNCFITYSNHLNTLSIKRAEISFPLLTHFIDSECDFNNPRVNFDAKQKMVIKIDNLLTEVIRLRPNVPTESNVNFKVLKKILERFCISVVDDKYESGLKKLLFFRNSIAHGENSLVVDMDQMTEFIELIENLMLDIAINIESSEKNGTFRKVIINNELDGSG
jgi:hypothetical protein